MKILLTNDDGIYAEGIFALHKELIKIGHVTVVAPDSERSSVGHGITLSHPIWFKKVQRKGRFFGYGISGTPADCVKFAVSVILKQKPDLVISGINYGGNDGCSVHYSGTVAGAREGALLGIPSIAASLTTFVNADFRIGAKFTAKLAQEVFKNKVKIPPGTFLSANIPNRTRKQIKGIQVTRQGLVPIHGDFDKRVDPNLREYYWMTGKVPPFKNDLNVDTYALRKNYITVTPVQCDLTDYRCLDEVKKWKLKI